MKIFSTNKFRIAILTIMVSMPGLCHSQVGHDTIMHDYGELPDVQVTTKRHTSKIFSRPNEIVMDLNLLDNMPKIMGNADPLHYSQSLPMVQTNNEYDGGLHIQGCDNSHNMLTIDGATIYNASHLLGFFSVFNASHFDKLSLRYSAQSASDPDRLGGNLRIYHSDSVDRKTGGTFTVGPMSSHGTLRLPVSARSSLKVSIRASYLNLLYGSLLKQDEGDFSYFFDDINMTFKYKPTGKNLLWLEVYGGSDKAGLYDGASLSDISMKWGNTMAAAHWKHESANDFQLHQTVYFSHFGNNADISQESVSGYMPSRITDLSYKADLAFRKFTVGISASHYHIKPQAPTITGSFTIESEDQTQDTQEMSAYAGWTEPFSEVMSMNAGLRGSLFLSPDQGTYSALDPSVTLSADLPINTSLSLSASTRHQYLFNVGMSGMNFPIEFWMAPFGRFAPQHSFNLDFSADQQISSNRYSLQLRLFYKRLWNQIEYKGTLFDMLYRDFRLQDFLIQGDGTNYGFSIMANKRTGKLLGYISYTFTHARRSFDELKEKDSYPAAHERPHELNVLATYDITDKWKVGATYVIASGTPFTAPKSFHAYSMNIVSTFGEHNANRLPAYSRLDLSVNYVLSKKKNRESGLNLSLYNVLYRSNPILYRLKFYKDEFAYRKVDFLVRILPSVSYYYNF